MGKNKPLNSFSALVYSTNPEAMKQDKEESFDTPAPALQSLKVSLDRKRRAGKVVTLVTGYEGTEEDFQALGKRIKTKCGTGGSAKDSEIIIQGDFKQKIFEWLKEWGYGVKML